MDITLLKEAAKSFGISTLQQETGISRSNIYGVLNGENTTLNTLERLANQLGYQLELKKIETRNSLEEPEFAKWSLAYWGAPLLCEQTFEKSAGLEETFLGALEAGRKDATINAILPTFISKNFEKIDWETILSKNIDFQYLGYQIHIILHLTSDTKLFSLLGEIQKRAGVLHSQRLIRNKRKSRFEEKRYELTDNSIAKNWKLKTADSLSSIRDRFNKWNLQAT